MDVILPRKKEAYRDENSVFRDTFLFQPLTQAADSHTCSFPNTGITILEASFDDRPDLTHQGSHVFAATLNADTKGEHSTTSECGIWRREILDDQSAECWENLSWWQVGGKSIDNAEGRLGIIMS